MWIHFRIKNSVFYDVLPVGSCRVFSGEIWEVSSREQLNRPERPWKNKSL
jgi:hypothetical protein